MGPKGRYRKVQRSRSQITESLVFPPSSGQTESPGTWESSSPLQKRHFLWVVLLLKAIEQNRGRTETLRPLEYFQSILVILMLTRPIIYWSAITEHPEASGQLLGVTSVLNKCNCTLHEPSFPGMLPACTIPALGIRRAKTRWQLPEECPQLPTSIWA